MPKKHFGQHFLHDQNILNKVIESIRPQATDNMVEIGPGPGALTMQVLPHLNALTAIEIDEELIPDLEEKCQSLGKLTVINQDVLSVDFHQFGKQLRIIGNLPYNISTPILFHLLKTIDNISDMHFMLQKEVVDRMIATPGNKDYGRLSVMLQYHFDMAFLFKVPANAFTPPPRVLSAIVRLVPRRPNNLPVVDQSVFSSVVKQAFAQRRKMLRKALHAMISSDQLETINIDPTARAEQLTVAEFCKICMMITSLKDKE